MDIILGLIYIIFALFLYFLPTIIAVKRDSASICLIFWMNLLFGWTCIVWFIILVLAIVSETFDAIELRTLQLKKARLGQ